ncbi:hypothetical protein ACDZ94_26810 (plasmid) [Pseudomonas sp. UBT]|uniref:hypothetical protein n=1 Tax=Pseudomonas sp. UBT TaxID=3239198 RepID=UPI003D805E1A
MNDIPSNGQALPEIEIEEFRARYPQLFSDPIVDEIYCDPGWRDLLLSLCHTLQSHLTRHPDVMPVTVAQIKSKFGELHFFYDGGDAYCRGAVDLAVGLSLKTCEMCGALGGLVGGKWVTTLCSAHNRNIELHR